MKPGTIVEFTPISEMDYGIATPKKNTPYTISGCRPAYVDNVEAGVGIFLEEIDINSIYPGCIYLACDFSELMPPIENIEEFINQNVTELEEA